jgi:hypothetical protein
MIRKNRERGTFMRKRMEDAVRLVVQDAPSQLQMLFSLSNSNELLFADYVLLTEGKTEWRVLPVLFEKMTVYLRIDKMCAGASGRGEQYSQKYAGSHGDGYACAVHC